MFNFSKTAATAFVVMASAFGVSAADHLTIIGSATPDSWNIKYGLLMVQDADNENVFTYMGCLKADEEFKFTSGKNFDNPNLEYRNESTDAYDVSKLVQGGQDNKFKVRESANYKVVCNLADMTVSVTKAAYQDNPVRFNALYIVGDAGSGGWEITDAPAMVWGGEEDPFKFTYNEEMKKGEFKIDANRYNGSWDGPWFWAGLDGDGNIDYDKITTDGNGDRKWQIPEDGRYNIEIDLLNNTVSITKTGNSGVADIEAGFEGTPVYYNLQGVVVTNPSNGIFIRKTGNRFTKVRL